MVQNQSGTTGVPPKEAAATIEALSAEIQTLRRCIHDLVALSALSAAGTDREPITIAGNLADMLLSTLRPDIIYIYLKGPADDAAIEVVRAQAEPGAANRADEIGQALIPSVTFDRSNPAPLIPNPVGTGMIRLAAIPIGHIGKDGVVVAGSRQADFPGDLDYLLLQEGANQLTTELQTVRLLIEQKQAEQALTEGARQQEALYQLADQLHRAQSLDELYKAAIHAIIRALACDRASILLFDDTGIMRFVGWQGLSDKYREATEGHSPWKPDEKNPEPIGINNIDYADLSGPLKAIIKEEGIGALAFIPLVSSGRLIGKFMTYFNGLHDFSENELELSLTIARQLAFGIDRIRAEVTLQRQSKLIELSFEPILVWESDGVIVNWNRGAEKLYGFTRTEAVGHVSHELLKTIHPVSLDEFHTMLERDQNWTGELQQTTKDGRTVLVESRHQVIEIDGRRLILEVNRDITKRRQAEDRLALLAKISELARTFEDGNELLFAVSKAVGRHLRVRRCFFNETDLKNDREIVHRDYYHDVESVAGVHKISDYSPITSAEMQAGKTVVNFDSKTDPRTADYYQKIYEPTGERAYIAVPLMREGHWVATLWVSDDSPREWSTHEISLLETVAEQIWSVVERLRIDSTLRESEARFRRLYNANVVGMALGDLEGQIYEANDEFLRIVGYSRADLEAGRINWKGLTPAEYLPIVSEAIAELLRTGQHTPYEKEYIRKDGTRIPVLVSRAYLGNETPSAFSVVVDLTPLKRAEQALREGEARFRMMADTAPVMIWMSDSNKQYTYFNKPWLEFTGRTIQEELDFGWAEGVHPDDRRASLATYAAAFEAGQPLKMEYRRRRADGKYRWVVDQAVPRFKNEQFEGYIGSCIDIHERKRSELEESLLAETGKVLASSLDPSVRLANVAQLAVPTLADWCAVTIFEEDWSVRYTAVAHKDPAKVQLARDLQRRYPPRQEELAKMTRPWQKGQPELYPVITEAMLKTDARDAEHHQILRELNLHSAMVVPLVARGKILGAIFFVWAESGYNYDEQDLALAEELARRAAIALDNVRLYEAEQLARQTAEETAGRIAALQTVTAALSVALTPAEVSKVILEQSTLVLEASGGAVMLLTEGGESLQIVQATGYSEAGVTPFLRFPLTASIPASDAVRSGQPVWITSHDDFKARYPHLASTRPAGSSTEGVAVVPLLVEGRILGALAISFNQAREFSAKDKDFLETLASLCAQTLERAHLYEAEHSARAEAEIAGERLSLLAEASKVLVASSDYQTNLVYLARLVVPSLADWCVVDILKEDRLIHRLAVIHHDPARAQLAVRLQQDYPTLDPHGEHTIAKTIRQGRSWFDPEVSEVRLVAEARDEKHLELLRGLGFASEMVVPLTARGRMLGTLTFVRASVERRYEMADLTLAEELARRAAIAMDNTQLYEAERRARMEAEAAQHSLALLAEARERNRLAQELHDNVAQTLGYLNLKIASLHQLFDAHKSEQVGAELSELKQVIGEAYTDIRGEIFNLRAGPSDEIDFLETLDHYIDKYKRFYQLDIQLIFEADRASFEFPAQISIPLIRTIQEALMNVRKHAQVDEAFLRFSHAGDHIHISIEDQGRGFDLTQEKASSFGLKIMRERIESIGGRLEIESLPGQGTRVTLRYAQHSERNRSVN